MEAKFQTSRDLFDHRRINYGCTNESLNSARIGMDLRSEDKVLGVLGSGDFRYLCLSEDIEGKFFDKNKDQVDYVKLRDKSLIEGDIDDFRADYAILDLTDPKTRIVRLNYFSTLNFQKIKSNLKKGEFFEGDIFSDSIDVSSFNKFYLSNVFDWIELRRANPQKFFSKFSQKLKKKDLVYFACKGEHFEDGVYSFLDQKNFGMKKNEELTNLAQNHQVWHWVTQVWEKSK